MKNLLYATAGLLLLITLNGCKKEDNAGSGVRDYIQFKVDGQLVRIENCPADVQNLGLGWHPSDLKLHTADSTYSLAAFVAMCNNTSTDASVVVSYIPLEVTNYLDKGTFRYEISANEYYSANTSLSAVNGNINIIRAERNLGGIIKGTFNFSNATYYNGSNTAAGHNITEGEFQVVIGQYHTD